MTTPDFFRAHLDAMIDMNHPLAILANRFPWIEIEAILSPFFARQKGEGKQVEVED